MTFIISLLSCCVSSIQFVRKDSCEKGQVTAMQKEVSKRVLTVSPFVNQLHGYLSLVRRLPRVSVKGTRYTPGEVKAWQDQRAVVLSF